MTHTVPRRLGTSKAPAVVLPSLCSAILIAALAAAVCASVGLSALGVMAAYSTTGAVVLFITCWRMGSAWDERRI